MKRKDGQQKRDAPEKQAAMRVRKATTAATNSNAEDKSLWVKFKSQAQLPEQGRAGQHEHTSIKIY